jgi:cytidine deaminase
MVAGVRDFSVLMIYVPGSRLFEPCGACRQVMLELMPSASAVYSASDVEQKRWTVGGLLPEPFVFTAE